MDSVQIWAIVGLVLILSELLATSIVAIFFGIAAILVSVLLWLGVIESIEMQFLIFGVLSLVLLFTARRTLRRWLVGDTVDSSDAQKSFQQNFGQRAIAKSEGERQAMINVSEGQKQEVINLSEADKLRQINEAEGRAREIELIAIATSEGLRKIASAITEPGGKDAVSLRVAEQYVKEFGNLAKANNTMIIPAELAGIGGVVASLSQILSETGSGRNPVK
jgi:membrane protein implicated in regulation of membrane protease activity